MDGNNPTTEQAAELLKQHKYREALAVFTKIYEQCTDENEREAILEKMDEEIYPPIMEELQTNYEKNLGILKQYPYFLGTLREYDELPFQLFPANDKYNCFSKEDDSLLGEYDADSPNRMRYFFENLDKPLFVENEDNLYNLNFLNDNVRASEDYAADNHIYLFYDTLEPLERLMLTCDLEPVLQQKKFVFLVGKENKELYPLDFKKEFGTDYDAMIPSPVRIEEIKRVCYWHYHARSGTEMSLAIIGALNEVQKLSGFEYHKHSTIDGQWIISVKEYTDAIADVDAVYTAEQISEMVRSEKYDLCLEEIEGFVDWLRRSRPAPHEYTVKELFCGYFLFQYEKRGLNPRIAPLLLYDPHLTGESPYNDLILSFPYHTAMTSIREPIMTFIRCQQVGIAGHDEDTTKKLLAHDYLHALYLPPKLQTCYYAIRFEDLKTKPEIACRALCRHLNVPYDKVMLEADAPDRARHHDEKGCFDTAPLHWDLSACLTDFDKMRLQIFYDPILRYYGYSTFPFEDHPLPEDLVRMLFTYPFRFESINPLMYGENAPAQEELRDWIHGTLLYFYGKKVTLPKMIPLEDRSEQETDQSAGALGGST